MRRSRLLVALLPFALAAFQTRGLAIGPPREPQNPPGAPAPAVGGVPQPAPAPAPQPPLAPGPAPDLDLVFTAQVIGWIEPCG